MNSQELKHIVEQRSNDASVLGRLACNLKSNQPEQRNADGRQLQVYWEEMGDLWRCTIAETETAGYLVRIDLHGNSAVRVEAREPCSVTISPEDDLLCLTRLRQAH